MCYVSFKKMIMLSCCQVDIESTRKQTRAKTVGGLRELLNFLNKLRDFCRSQPICFADPLRGYVDHS